MLAIPNCLLSYRSAQSFNRSVHQYVKCVWWRTRVQVGIIPKYSVFHAHPCITIFLLIRGAVAISNQGFSVLRRVRLQFWLNNRRRRDLRSLGFIHYPFFSAFSCLRVLWTGTAWYRSQDVSPLFEALISFFGCRSFYRQTSERHFRSRWFSFVKSRSDVAECSEDTNSGCEAVSEF